MATVRAKLKFCKTDPNELLALDDAAFQKHLGTNNKPTGTDRIIPDWSYIQNQLQLNDMTLSLLWEEYRYQNSDQIDKCLEISRFCGRYKTWLSDQRISMRQLHKPGEKLFMDFCGRTVSIVDRETGSISKANIFVGVLGASGYIYVLATPSMTSADWIRGSVGAFEYFQGVPQQIIPDNPKATVILNSPDKIIINRAFADFAHHYDVIVNPARPRKPKDKSLAEIGVQIVQRWMLAALRDHTFFSIEELNIEIEKRLDKLNAKTTKTYPHGRIERFNQIDKPALSPLPIERYEIAEWVYKVRVPNDYHVSYNESFYSVPYQNIKKQIDLRITERVIEILLDGKRITSHELSQNTGSIVTKKEHMPLEHLHQTDADPEALLIWAQEIGPNTFEWAIKNIKNRSDFANGVRSVSRLKKWVRLEQNHHRLESACEFALKIDAIPFKRLQNIIVKNSDLRVPMESLQKVIEHENIRGADYYSTEGIDDAK